MGFPREVHENLSDHRRGPEVGRGKQHQANACSRVPTRHFLFEPEFCQPVTG